MAAHIISIKRWKVEKDRQHDNKETLHKRKSVLILRAARTIMDAWLDGDFVPACPHCFRGVFPEDGMGCMHTPIDLEIAKRIEEPPRYAVGAESELLEAYGAILADEDGAEEDA